MSDYYFNDYDKFIEKNITVIYDCGSKCKKLHCKLLRYCEKSPKEKLIILKSHTNTIYNINCDKIIYWIAEYDDLHSDNQCTYNSNTTRIESDKAAKSEDLLLEKTQDKGTISFETSNLNNQLQEAELLQCEESISSCSANSSEENTALIPNEDAACNDPQENSIILEEYNNNDTNKKNVLSSSLAAFINCNFQGVYLTIYTTSTQAISGEVIFNYDHLIALKSDEKTYYINPEQITYFC